MTPDLSFLLDGSAGDQYIGLDRFGRVIDQRWTTSGGTAKDRFGYGYDRDSNRLYKENLLDSTRSELYAYDGLNQITSMQRGALNGTKDGITGTPSRSQAWDFDALGNFDSQTTDGTAQTRTHNKQNEITSISGATTPTYDANGNLTKDEAGRTFQYDAWNRDVEVRDSGNNLLATYRYDGLNRRVRETRGGTTTDLYYSDQWQVLEERVGGAVQSSYAWSPVYVDAMIARDRDADGNGANGLEERLYAAQDANSNVIALIDISGTVVERAAEDAFGSPTFLTATWGARSGSSYSWVYLHQGLRYDAPAGDYNVRERDYSPTLGRWLQTDPSRFTGGTSNLFEAFGNSPVLRVDPSGLQSAGPVPPSPMIPPAAPGDGKPTFPIPFPPSKLPPPKLPIPTPDEGGDWGIIPRPNPSRPPGSGLPGSPFNPWPGSHPGPGWDNPGGWYFGPPLIPPARHPGIPELRPDYPSQDGWTWLPFEIIACRPKGSGGALPEPFKGSIQYECKVKLPNGWTLWLNFYMKYDDKTGRLIPMPGFPKGPDSVNIPGTGGGIEIPLWPDRRR